MKDARPKVLVAAVAGYVVGVVLVIAGVVSAADGAPASIPWLVVGVFALMAGATLTLILAKDPARTGAPTSSGARRPSVHLLEFEVGEHETHAISYRWDQTWGWLTVTVDGSLIARQLVMYSVRLARSMEFEVGTNEKHVIRIEKRRPLVTSFARPQPLTAYVDGVAIAMHDGGTAPGVSRPA